jgi:hypothetical protein
MTSPPAMRPVSAVPAQIRVQQIAALKFCSNDVDVRDKNGLRIDVISQWNARQFLAIGGYEAIGQATIKYLRRLPATGGPIDGPKRNVPPRASENHTTANCGNEHAHRFPPHNHPWKSRLTS